MSSIHIIGIFKSIKFIGIFDFISEFYLILWNTLIISYLLTLMKYLLQILIYGIFLSPWKLTAFRNSASDFMSVPKWGVN